MVRNDDITTVARIIKRRLNGQAFMTLTRADVSGLVREASGTIKTRLTSVRARQLDGQLLESGVFVHPEVAQTTAAAENIRFYRAGTVAAEVANIILHPTEQSDRSLAALTLKAKGAWNWGDVGAEQIANDRSRR